MYALVHPFVQLVLLRLKPQDLPPSPLLMGLTLVAHFVLGTALFLLLFKLPALQSVLASATGTILLCVMTLSLLYLNRLQARAVQVITALAGADVLVSVASLPVSTWLQMALASGASGELPGMLFLLLLGWNLTVAGHVLRHALSAPLSLGLLVAVAFYIVSVNILRALFPGIA